MKRFLFQTLVLLILSTFILSLARPVFAHGEEPRLDISSDRINPGGVIEVRGVDLEFEEVVVLALIGSKVEIPLGEITADTEGIFLMIVTLPLDLQEGTYQFRAVTDDHEILSSAFLVSGPAPINEEGGGQGQREEDDALLAPMPTFLPATTATPIPATAGKFAPAAIPAAPAAVTKESGPAISPLSTSIASSIILGGFFLIWKRAQKPKK